MTAPQDRGCRTAAAIRSAGSTTSSRRSSACATNNFVTFVDKLGGKQTEVFNGVDFAVNARLRQDLFVTGGLATGNTHFNTCDAFVDNPRPASACPSRPPAAGYRTRCRAPGRFFCYCDFDTSWLTQVKATGSYTLPWQEIQIGGVLQNLPGQQITAQWNITQAEAAAGTLGRALSGGANTSRTVPLIKPGTMYTPRRTQLDLRVCKSIRFSRVAETAGDGRHLQRVQLQRRRRRDVERGRAAGGDQHDLRVGVAQAVEYPAGAVREVRRPVPVLPGA